MSVAINGLQPSGFSINGLSIDGLATHGNVIWRRPATPSTIMDFTDKFIEKATKANGLTVTKLGSGRYRFDFASAVAMDMPILDVSSTGNMSEWGDWSDGYILFYFKSEIKTANNIYQQPNNPVNTSENIVQLTSTKTTPTSNGYIRLRNGSSAISAGTSVEVRMNLLMIPYTSLVDISETMLSSLKSNNSKMTFTRQSVHIYRLTVNGTINAWQNLISLGATTRYTALDSGIVILDIESSSFELYAGLWVENIGNIGPLASNTLNAYQIASFASKGARVEFNAKNKTTLNSGTYFLTLKMYTVPYQLS